MTRYIAFLRAINVGGHVVKMDNLRQIFETLGLSHVKTFIASGNVIFESDKREAQTLEMKIASQLHRSLGYEAATFIRTAAEVAEIAHYHPFPEPQLNAAGASLYIGFTAEAPSPDAQAKVLSLRTPVDDFHVHQREIYWCCQIRSSDSQFSLARLEKALGVQATFRNSTTIRKMAKLYAVG
jgi:uncharacterized protein (DUF1697 family)